MCKKVVSLIITIAMVFSSIAVTYAVDTGVAAVSADSSVNETEDSAVLLTEGDGLSEGASGTIGTDSTEYLSDPYPATGTVSDAIGDWGEAGTPETGTYTISGEIHLAKTYEISGQLRLYLKDSAKIYRNANYAEMTGKPLFKILEGGSLEIVGISSSQMVDFDGTGTSVTAPMIQVCDGADSVILQYTKFHRFHVNNFAETDSGSYINKEAASVLSIEGDCGDINIDSCTFENIDGGTVDSNYSNDIFYYSSAICVGSKFNSQLNIKRTNFYHCHALYGGAINIVSNSNAPVINLTGCTFEGCDAGEDGGAIYAAIFPTSVVGPTLNINYCNVGNLQTNASGASLGNSAKFGGGIFSGVTTNIRNSNIIYNFTQFAPEELIKVKTDKTDSSGNPIYLEVSVPDTEQDTVEPVFVLLVHLQLKSILKTVIFLITKY